MVNPFHDIDWHPDEAARRHFGRSLVTGFGIIGAVLLLVVRVRSGSWAAWPAWLGVTGAALGAVCWAVPRIARPMYLSWYVLGASIGIVVSNTLLVLTYVLTVVPIGLALRLFGRDPMRRRFEPDRPSYWKPVPGESPPDSYLRQF